MSLREDQSAFARDVVSMLTFAFLKGFEVTFGEAQRTPEQQAIYLKEGKSKTADSMHLKKCAIDLFFFKDGELIEDREALKILGDFWESLNTKNRWGGSWRGKIERGESTFNDWPHYERHA